MSWASAARTSTSTLRSEFTPETLSGPPAGPIAKQVGGAFGIGSTAVLVWDIAKWPVLIVLVSVMVTLLYKATPNVKQPSFKWVSAGGVLAVIIWLIASALFAVYVSFSGSYKGSR